MVPTYLYLCHLLSGSMIYCCILCQVLSWLSVTDTFLLPTTYRYRTVSTFVHSYGIYLPTASTHWGQQDSPRMKHEILSLSRGLPTLSPIKASLLTLRRNHIVIRNNESDIYILPTWSVYIPAACPPSHIHLQNGTFDSFKQEAIPDKSQHICSYLHCSWE